jgi:uncharacterized membrane protein
LLTHPKGIIANSELHLMTTNVLLMLAVIIPTYILLLITVRKKDRKFKPFSAFFPCGGEGKTWRRA